MDSYNDIMKIVKDLDVVTRLALFSHGQNDAGFDWDKILSSDQKQTRLQCCF